MLEDNLVDEFTEIGDHENSIHVCPEDHISANLFEFIASLVATKIVQILIASVLVKFIFKIILGKA